MCCPDHNALILLEPHRLRLWDLLAFHGAASWGNPSGDGVQDVQANALEEGLEGDQW